jgi:glycosyltransferase involved in cell wall biosynthesis
MKIKSTSGLFNYVLITSAKNEERFISLLIEAVINQSVLPKRWLIVDDNSNDSTLEIINNFAKVNTFIKILNSNQDGPRSFASKAIAINRAYKLLIKEQFDYVGILDADVTFDSEYYYLIIKKFLENPRLGMAGGGFFDIYDGKKRKIIPSSFNVRGAIQLFRRKCFEDISGYKPLKYGGLDSVACISARMHGWEVQTFDELTVLHHRHTGTVDKNNYKRRFLQGIAEYHIGYIPLFEFLKFFNQIKRRPFIIGSLLRVFGYLWTYFKRESRIVSKEFLQFHKSEQLRRIKTFSIK